MIRAKRPIDDWRITNGIHQEAWRILACWGASKGHKPTYHTFDTQAEAQKWVRRIEAEIDTDFYVDNSAAEKMTLGEALKQYRRDVAAKKRHPKQEYGRIDRWLRNDRCFRTLANLKGADFARYRDQRRAQGKAENTIQLELQLVSHIYEIARKEWGMEGLMNPLKNIRKPSVSAARDRRLEPREYEKIKAVLTESGIHMPRRHSISRSRPA